MGRDLRRAAPLRALRPLVLVLVLSPKGGTRTRSIAFTPPPPKPIGSSRSTSTSTLVEDPGRRNACSPCLVPPGWGETPSSRSALCPLFVLVLVLSPKGGTRTRSEARPRHHRSAPIASSRSTSTLVEDPGRRNACSPRLVQPAWGETPLRSSALLRQRRGSTTYKS